MREIKFKIWDKGNDEWKIFNLKGLHESGVTYHLDYSKVCQFTGLKDKNGKEIYEGDIFQDDEDGSCESVEWDNEFGGWSTQAWYSVGEFAQCASELEVIGNIYENPELLN